MPFHISTSSISEFQLLHPHQQLALSALLTLSILMNGLCDGLHSNPCNFKTFLLFEKVTSWKAKKSLCNFYPTSLRLISLISFNSVASTCILTIVQGTALEAREDARISMTWHSPSKSSVR